MTYFSSASWRKKIKSVEKGVTIIEVIITMILSVIIISFVTSFFGTVVRNLKGTNDDFTMQTTMRAFSQSVKSEIVNSPTVFLIDKEQFTDEKIEQSPFWNYIGVKDIIINGKKTSQLLWYVYDVDTSTHRAINLTEPVEDITYTAAFERKSGDANEKMIKFKLEGFVNNKGSMNVPNEVIESMLMAQNADQVLDWSRGVAVALAYRSDELKAGGSEKSSGAGLISLVLDSSSSMINKMVLNSNDNRDSRTYALRESVKTLINKFSGNDNVFLSLNTFGSTAFDIQTRLRPEIGRNNSFGRIFRLTNKESSFGKDDLAVLYEVFEPEFLITEKINLEDPSYRVIHAITSLGPSGLTNIGDGLRYAKSFKINDMNNIKDVLGLSSISEIRSFLILMTDGSASALTIYNNDEKLAVLEDYDGTILTKGIYVSTHGMYFPLTYAVEIAKKIKNEAPFDDYYFVTLGLPLYKSGFVELAKGLGLNPYDSDFANHHMFETDSLDALNDAFGKISESINLDMEYIIGPKR